MQTISSDQRTRELTAEPGRLIKPLRLALIISGAFLLVTFPYILISGKLALESSATLLDLGTIERIKGSIFVFTTSAVLFVLCYWLFRRIARREQELSRYRSALIASERRAAAGLFASSVAHDMNNVLSIIEYATHALGKHGTIPDPDILDDLRQANTQLKRLSRVLLRGTGRNLSDTIADFNLATAVSETAELARTHKKVKRCTVTVETPSTLPFTGTPIMIHQMVLNLIINAADATNGTGSIDIRLTAKDDGALIAVHDSGSGVPEVQRDAVMEPFYTTKTDGSGLGLLSVKVCAEAHDGHVEIDKSKRLGGACFRVFLQSKRRIPSIPHRKSGSQPEPSGESVALAESPDS